MNEITQIDDYSLENFENNEDTYEKNRSRYEGTPLLLAVQLTVSLVVLTVMFAFKFIGGEHFNLIRSWYFENINNSLIAGTNLKEAKETFDIKIPFINLQNKEKIVTTSCINAENNLESVPVELSVPVSNPIDKGIITSRFGKRTDPISGKEKIHYGLDICSDEGSPIYAVMPGIVEKAENSPSFGNILILDHGNNIKTLYAHCKELKVCVGDNIKRGQNIALMGNTGYYSAGTHLHVELIINGKKYDPEPFFENISV